MYSLKIAYAICINKCHGHILQYVAIINTSIWHKYYTKISSISVSSINIFTDIFYYNL